MLKKINISIVFAIFCLLCSTGLFFVLYFEHHFIDRSIDEAVQLINSGEVDIRQYADIGAALQSEDVVLRVFEPHVRTLMTSAMAVLFFLGIHGLFYRSYAKLSKLPYWFKWRKEKDICERRPPVILDTEELINQRKSN